MKALAAECGASFYLLSSQASNFTTVCIFDLYLEISKVLDVYTTYHCLNIKKIDILLIVIPPSTIL